jgi:purine-binding chemotaxis protein CheW
MKKKRILYSELAPDAPTAAPQTAAATVQDMTAAAPTPARKSAPVDLARALAAAREAEQRAAAAPVTAAAASLPASNPSPTPVPTTPRTPRSLRDRARARAGHAEILVFRVGNERFGVDLAAVEEAIDIPPVHHVPEMPPAMLGVITVRGTLTSVYSPAVSLGLSLHDGTSALIFRRGRSRLAIVVDEVDDASSLDLSLLRDAPALDSSDGIVLGVVRQHDALLALVDTDALLAACQAAPLLETA